MGQTPAKFFPAPTPYGTSPDMGVLAQAQAAAPAPPTSFLPLTPQAPAQQPQQPQQPQPGQQQSQLQQGGYLSQLGAGMGYGGSNLYRGRNLNF